MSLDRREFLCAAAAIGASAAWADSTPQPSSIVARERRDLYPEGVASGDPDAHSVILWTRRPTQDGSAARLLVEVSEDPSFTSVVATVRASVSASFDWTCRALVGNLKPSHVYWYRFIDAAGHASRVGRTLTAPRRADSRPVSFAFVSCQEVTVGAQHAYRRMIYEDERAPELQRLSFVLHLGDFYYEAVLYPEDGKKGYFDRQLRDVIRYPHGEKIGDWHFPTTVEDFRIAYRAYLHDPDLQDARARWPFVCIWDNGEFSWEGWQSIQVLSNDSGPRPAQTRKVAANQVWFEYQPARIRQPDGTLLDKFRAPSVVDAPVREFDPHGLGQELNNLAALNSLTGYRAQHWGRHVHLIITDQRSYCSQPILTHPEAQAFRTADFPRMFPQEALEILDAGRAYAEGKPPEAIPFDGKGVLNFRKDHPPLTLLGTEQKAWFLNELRTSTSTWKIWGNSVGTLDGRTDPQNLPAGLTRPFPGSGYACFQLGDFATAYLERAQIYKAVKDAQVTGFVTVCGNSHAFYAGLAAPWLPPRPFEPVGIAFITGSISAVGAVEGLEHSLPRNHPLRALYLVDGGEGAKPQPTANLLLRHGVKTCLEYAVTGDLTAALKRSNPDLAPHLSFIDLAGHGYAIVRASAETLECEFVCIPRPIERSTALDGGPLVYRVRHWAVLWAPGETPRLEQRILEGHPDLC